MPRILRNYEGQCLIELSRTDKKVRAITLVDTYRDVREFPIQCTERVGAGENSRLVHTTFDRTWTQVPDSEGYDYPLEKAVLNWLESKYIPLTERAKKELVMLVLSFVKDQVIGKFADVQTAVDASPSGAEVIAMNAEELGTLTNADITRYHNVLVSEENKVNRFSNKAQAIEKTIAAAEAFIVTLPAPAAKKNNTTSNTGEKKERKMGVKEQLREKFVNGGSATLEELIAEFGGEEKKSSVTTALSDLKSEKYAGKAGPLNIVKTGKIYHLEGVAVAAPAAEAPATSEAAPEVAEEQPAAEPAE